MIDGRRPCPWRNVAVVRPEGWLETALTELFRDSPRRGKRRFLGNETRSWEVADVRLDEVSEHLARTHALLRLVYDAYWDYIGEQPGNPDDPELIDEFTGRLDPLDPWAHERLLLGDAVKEAVSIAEVYLVDLSRHVLPHAAANVPVSNLRDGLDRNSYPKLISGLKETFGVYLRNRSYWTEWSEFRATRHLLTHNWGRYNAKYFDDATRPLDTYDPRVPESPHPPQNALEAQSSTTPIELTEGYAMRALGVARLIVDDVEAELGSAARQVGLDWYS